MERLLLLKVFRFMVVKSSLLKKMGALFRQSNSRAWACDGLHHEVASRGRRQGLDLILDDFLQVLSNCEEIMI